MTTRSRVVDSHHKFSSAGLKYPYQQGWKMVRPCEQQGRAIKARAINCHPILVRPFPTPLHLAQANPARARCTLSVYLLIFVSTAQTISVITDTQLRLLLFGERTEEWT